MAKSPLLFQPGSDWEYGFSTDVLGLVIEAVTGEKLGADAWESESGNRLAMADTGFDLSSASDQATLCPRLPQ